MNHLLTCFITYRYSCEISGNAYISLHGTSAGRTLENLATGLITLLIRISSFFHLSVYRQERYLETVQPCAAAQEPEPQREEDMSACLRRLKKLESLCDHLMSKPPDMPKEKELVLMQSFDRIKSLEAELEATKNVSWFFLLLITLCRFVGYECRTRSILGENLPCHDDSQCSCIVTFVDFLFLQSSSFSE